MTPNFDRVARLYRWAEYLTLGRLLESTRTHFLPELDTCRSALVLGDGDGRFLAALLSHQPTLAATAVDTSVEMLTLLRRRCDPFANRLTTLQGDALSLPLPETDLIVTHFFLDCLTQPEVDALALRLSHPGALWVLSDFRVPTGPLRPLARLYIRSLYFAFRLLTGLRVTHLPDPAAALRAAGFQPLAQHRKLFGILYTELWQIPQPIDANPDAVTSPGYNLSMTDRSTDRTQDRPAPIEDAIPDPEPAVPSLPEPDPGVFHHGPAPGTQQK